MGSGVKILATGLTPIDMVGATGAGAEVTVNEVPAEEITGPAAVNSLESPEVPCATTTPPEIHPPFGHVTVRAYT
jgi:hypothetical protein